MLLGSITIIFLNSEFTSQDNLKSFSRFECVADKNSIVQQLLGEN